MRARRQAWGVTTLWIGAGARPAAGVGRPRALDRRTRTATAAHDGRLVLHLPPAVGADPRVLRAPRPARRRRPTAAVRRTGVHVHHVLATRASSARSPSSRPMAARDRAHGARHRDDRHDPGRPVAARRPRARPRRHGHRQPGRRRDERAHRLPLPVHRWRTSATSTALLADLAPLGAGEGRRERRPAGRRRSNALDADAGGRRGGDGRAVRRAAGGCSPSATAAAPPTPPALAALFSRPPAGRPLPARCLADDTAVLTALGNDVGFDLVFSRQLIAHGRRGRHRARAVDQRQLAQPAGGLRRGAAPAGCSRWASPATTAARWPRRADVDHCLVVRGRQRPPHPGDPGGARLRALARGPATLDRPEAQRWLTSTPPDRREAAVLDRIEAFRRRRPRLTDEVVTLAHGAGGKASAALVDAVFLDAFANGELGAARRRRHPRRCRGGDAARLQHRLVRRAARGASPAARSATSPCTARSTTWPCRAPTPQWLSAAFVIEEGFPVAELRAIVGRHGRGRGRRRRRHRHRRHQGRRPGRGRRPVHHDRRRRRAPGRPARSAPSWCSPATSCWSRARSPTTAWR